MSCLCMIALAISHRDTWNTHFSAKSVYNSHKLVVELVYFLSSIGYFIVDWKGIFCLK